MAAPVADATPAAGLAAPPPAAAPHLGTKWGEGLSSPVHDVNLARFSPGQPDAQVSVYYNDERGAYAQAGAYAQRIATLPLADGRIEFSVTGENGVKLPMLWRGQADSAWLIGRRGERYAMQFYNRGSVIIEIVATVDGLDVINGQPGSIANRGYILYPGKNLTISGFRKSDTEVAAFRFSNPGNAYAANTPNGDRQNIGVIGIAGFTVYDPTQPQPQPQPTPSPFPADPRYAPPPTYP